MSAAAVVEPWSDGNLELLHGLLADPAMMTYLGGPETPERIAERQASYAQAGSRQYRIADAATGTPAGWVGYWESTHHDEPIFELGWAILPAFQGRGLARSGTAQVITHARSEPEPRPLVAFPAVANAASNALCHSLGFGLVGPEEFEYPPGSALLCNVWRLERSP